MGIPGTAPHPMPLPCCYTRGGSVAPVMTLSSLASKQGHDVSGPGCLEANLQVQRGQSLNDRGPSWWTRNSASCPGHQKEVRWGHLLLGVQSQWAGAREAWLIRAAISNYKPIPCQALHKKISFINSLNPHGMGDFFFSPFYR